MSNTTMAWSQWLRWLDEVEAAELERRRTAPPLALKDSSDLESSGIRRYSFALQKHSHLAEQGKKLLAEYLHLNQ